MLICLASVLMIVTCASCKTEVPYKVKDYLNYLANKSGISSSEKIEDNFDALLSWKVVEEDDIGLLECSLNTSFLARTICNLIEENEEPIKVIKDLGYINTEKNDDLINQKTAEEIINKAVNLINNKTFPSDFNFAYRDNVKEVDDDLYDGDIILDDNKFYKINVSNDGEINYEDAEFEDVYSQYDISDSFEIDFSNAEIIPLQEELSDSSYINKKYNLLANKTHVFNKDGFRISYSFSSNSLDVHVSKKEDKVTLYGDASINSIKPNFKWTYKDGDLKNCYFNVTMNTTTSLGATIGKYGNYYVKLKDLDSSSFMSSIKNIIVPKQDEIEAVIPICQIKTPIPNVPFANIDMTIGIKLYASGRVEIILYNSHNIGFEIKDGHSRFFYEHDDDLDTILRASTKLALAINFALETTDFRICDFEFDGGIKAEVKPTIHLYDSDFNETSEESNISYDTLEEISKDNNFVKVCGDVSLYWLLDLYVNTSKTLLAKWGFKKIYHVFDEDNQVFGNLHHIENGQFVKKCTRRNKVVIANQQIQAVASNKIVLNTYAEVINKGNSFKIEILSLPKGYKDSDIKYESSNSNVAYVDKGTIYTKTCGSTKIKVCTSDGKYSSYINVLVSTG